jgi:hypothetical protein
MSKMLVETTAIKSKSRHIATLIPLKFPSVRIWPLQYIPVGEIIFRGKNINSARVYFLRNVPGIHGADLGTSASCDTRERKRKHFPRHVKINAAGNEGVSKLNSPAPYFQSWNSTKQFLELIHLLDFIVNIVCMNQHCRFLNHYWNQAFISKQSYLSLNVLAKRKTKSNISWPRQNILRKSLGIL